MVEFIDHHVDWANADDLYDSDENAEPEPEPESIPEAIEVEDTKEVEGNPTERRAHRGRGRRRGKRYRRGNQTRYEAKESRPKSLRELVPARPGEITNVNPGISTGKFYFTTVEMIKSAKSPYVIQFLNCPEGLSKESFAELFEIKVDDIIEIRPIEKTNGVLHTSVSIKEQDIALKVFAKYTKENVQLKT